MLISDSELLIGMFKVPKGGEVGEVQHMPKKSPISQRATPCYFYNMPSIAKLEHSWLQINFNINPGMIFSKPMQKTKAKRNKVKMIRMKLHVIALAEIAHLLPKKKKKDEEHQS